MDPLFFDSHQYVLFQRNEFLIGEQWNILIVEIGGPSTYTEALDSLESDKWLEAMK